MKKCVSILDLVRSEERGGNCENHDRQTQGDDNCIARVLSLLSAVLVSTSQC